jgi:hypothetical protein
MTPAISGQETNRYEATAERFIRLLNAGDYSGVQKMFASEMDAALPGDKAAALCGNSGNSSEPHLHYHLQHESRLPEGLGIKAFFERVVIHKDGKSETRSDYSPIKGDVISPE